MGDSWKTELTIDMIPDGIYKAIAEEIGLDNLLKLVRIVGGCSLYFQREEALLRPLRDKKIAEEFNNGNASAAELGKKYGVTDRTAMKIANRALRATKEEKTW